jgi:alginate O-acetyltransferase complex protein AlgI
MILSADTIFCLTRRMPVVFTSQIFLFGFLPLTFILYAISNKVSLKLSNIVLLCCSLGFMFWGNGLDILVLIAVILINFTSGYALHIARNKNVSLKGERLILALGIMLSLGILVFYKYTFFIIDNSFNLLNIFGLNLETPSFVKGLLLPLGISFYTFQALSYTLDVYFKKVDYTKSIINFSLYVSFFPQLIAGPIVRYRDIYKQIQNRSTNIDRIYRGSIRFLEGFVKKVLLANMMAKVADQIFALDIVNLHAGLAWIAAIAYFLQIYLDFSAYSDMAIGLACMFGFDLLENFNLPYTAVSIQDFWRRWHISLSSWFRDYLYIPLGGNRKGEGRTYLNLIIVFFLCGLWHGAEWTFVIWGLWNGLFLVLERTKFGKLVEKLPRPVSTIYVFLIVIIGWVFFRSENLASTMTFLRIMFIPAQFSGELYLRLGEFLQNDVIISGVFSIIASFGGIMYFKKRITKSVIGKNIYVIILIALFILGMFTLYSDGYNPFIYFRF